MVWLLNKIKGWKTWVFNLLCAAVAAVELAIPIIATMLQMPEVKGILPPGWEPWWMLAVAFVNLYLRRLTTTPLGKKEDGNA